MAAVIFVGRTLCVEAVEYGFEAVFGNAGAFILYGDDGAFFNRHDGDVDRAARGRK